MARKLSSVADVHQLLRSYERGTYTRLEVIGELVSAGATRDVTQLAAELPDDWLSALHECTASPPRSVSDVFTISGGTYRAGFEHEREARETEMRRHCFEGTWNWHRYFAGSIASASGSGE